MSKLALPQSEAKYRLLLDISQQISRTMDLQDVVAGLLGSVRSVVGYDAAGIFVLHRNMPFRPAPDTNLIAAMASVGFGHSAERTDPMLRSGKGIVGHVIRTGETVVAPDVSRDPHYIQGRAQTRSEIAVPIVSNDEVIGALNLESDELDAFSIADAELLEAFAVAAAICIEKTFLHQQVVEKRLMEQHLKIAREVQASLLPADAPIRHRVRHRRTQSAGVGHRRRLFRLLSSRGRAARARHRRRLRQRRVGGAAHGDVPRRAAQRGAAEPADSRRHRGRAPDAGRVDGHLAVCHGGLRHPRPRLRHIHLHQLRPQSASASAQQRRAGIPPDGKTRRRHARQPADAHARGDARAWRYAGLLHGRRRRSQRRPRGRIRNGGPDRACSPNRPRCRPSASSTPSSMRRARTPARITTATTSRSSS